MPAAAESFGTSTALSGKPVVRTVAWTSGAAMVASFLFVPSTLAADQLACADTRALQRIRENLQNASQNARPPLKLSELKDAREVSLGAPPRSANTHATTTTFIAISRYCEGRAKFQAATPEPVYWRLDQFNDCANETSRIDLCHEFFDQFGDGCKTVRPGAS